jgi:hypothetical protein
MNGLKRRLLIQLGLAAILSLAIGAQARNADTVLREMRTALGGDAALDAIKTLSVSGTLNHFFGGRSRGSSLEMFAILPDHFLEVRRSSSMSTGPAGLGTETTNYRGFRADVLIRRTDSTFPVPPDPGPQTPAAIAARERDYLQNNRRDFARWSLALFGRSFAGALFSYIGPEVVDKQATEVIEVREADGFVMRLYVDQKTHLPALIAWQAPPTPVITTVATSTVAVRGGQVVSQSTPSFVPTGPLPPALPDVTWQLVFSDFKVQDGLNWPHRFKEMMGSEVTRETRLGKFKINPKIDARKFNSGR